VLAGGCRGGAVEEGRRREDLGEEGIVGSLHLADAPRRRRPRKPRNRWWECGLGLGFGYKWDIRIWEFGGLLVGCCLLGCLCM
jgi:hypothetical protein